MSNTKEILLLVEFDRLMAVIPKKRGEGFLKSPIGHHSAEWITELEHVIGTDAVGLDGMIEVDGRGRDMEQLAAAFTKGVTAAFGFPVRRVDRGELWDNVPIPHDAPKIGGGPRH